MSDTMSESEIVATSISIDPPRCGIYFLIANDQVMYVGNHLERAYLDAFLPPWNFDRETARKRGDPRPLRLMDIPGEPMIDTMPPSAPLPANPWDDLPPLSPEEEAEARAIAEVAEEDYQTIRERMLAVRKIRQSRRYFREDR